MRKLRLAVLVSGGGTNLQSLLDRTSAGLLSGQVVVVASDRPDAYGLKRAEEAGIPAHVIDYSHYNDKVQDPLELDLPFDVEELDRTQRILKISDTCKRRQRLAALVSAERELADILESYQPDYVCLAGFMRLVSPYFIGRFNKRGQWRILNIHPSLLPSFPGQHGYEDTFIHGCKWGGITVHFVDEGEDSGPIIAQAVYPVWVEDDLQNVRHRGLQLEYEVYAQCLNWLAAGQVIVDRGHDGRVRVRVTDPAYADILRSWTEKAFQNGPMGIPHAP